MQPTFLPWIGYLAMFEYVDIFVFLDSVQFAKRSWQQRNQIKTASGPQWLTMPVKSKGLRDQPIIDVQIETEANPQAKILNAIKTNYSSAPFFNEYFPAFERVFLSEATNLCELNIQVIRWLLQSFGVQEKKWVRSSNFDFQGAKADLMVNICNHFGAKVYLSALGSKEYNEQSTAFTENGIKIVYHQFQHPTYHQAFGEFVPFMSAIDLLFNEGPSARRFLLEGLKGLET